MRVSDVLPRALFEVVFACAAALLLVGLQGEIEPLCRRPLQVLKPAPTTKWDHAHRCCSLAVWRGLLLVGIGWDYVDTFVWWRLFCVLSVIVILRRWTAGDDKSFVADEQ